MSAILAQKIEKVDGLSVVPSCVVQVIDGDRWKTLAQVAYAPNPIAAVLKKHGLRWAWVKWACGRESWELHGGSARECK